MIDPNRLKALRQERGMSREALEKDSHVSVRQIARIEKAEAPVNVRPTTMKRLARALRVDSQELTREPLSKEDPVALVHASMGSKNRQANRCREWNLHPGINPRHRRSASESIPS